ncbi:MAG: ATP-dependent helicase, partial [Candidatus Omnitrophica bacterium]|nr:ATP-dependent helicase [Candidatus Omnitrophota bacterium]
MESYPEAKKINLLKNYRSGQAILDSAYRLIQHNNPDRFEVKAGVNRRLVGLNEGIPTKHLHFDSYMAESDYIAKFIKEKVNSGNYSFADFAVLVRSNSDAESILQTFNIQGIPWQFSGGTGLYQRPEIKLCLDFLRTVADPLDSVCFYSLAVSEIFNLDIIELTQCSHYAKRKNLSLYELFKEIEDTKELGSLSEDFLKKVKYFLEKLHSYIKLSKENSTGTLLYTFLTESGYLKKLVENPSIENEMKIQNLAKFFRIIRDLGMVIKEDRVFRLVPHLELLIQAGDEHYSEVEPYAEAVNVLTVHKAKGLEFRVVFLANLVQGKFPWPKRPQVIDFPEALIKETLPSG